MNHAAHNASPGRSPADASNASSDAALALPIWSFSDKEPRPVRIVRRIFWVWAALALISVLRALLTAEEIFADTSAMKPMLGLLLAAALCMVVAMPRRHIAWYIGRWVVPVLYVAILVGARRFILLLPTMILLVPYIKNMTQTGLRAWFQPDSTIRAALYRSTP